MKVTQVVEARCVTSAYIGYGDDLRLDVEGGKLVIELDARSLRRVAKVINEKITEQDTEAAEAAKRVMETIETED